MTLMSCLNDSICVIRYYQWNVAQLASYAMLYLTHRRQSSNKKFNWSSQWKFCREIHPTVMPMLPIYAYMAAILNFVIRISPSLSRHYTFVPTKMYFLAYLLALISAFPIAFVANFHTVYFHEHVCLLWIRQKNCSHIPLLMYNWYDKSTIIS